MPDHDIKHDAVTLFPAYCSKKKEKLNQKDFTRPDALLDSGWFGDSTDQSVLQDALGALLGENFQG